MAVNGRFLTRTMRCSRQESLSVGYTAHQTRSSQFSEGKHFLGTYAAHQPSYKAQINDLIFLFRMENTPTHDSFEQNACRHRYPSIA